MHAAVPISRPGERRRNWLIIGFAELKLRFEGRREKK